MDTDVIYTSTLKKFEEAVRQEERQIWRAKIEKATAILNEEPYTNRIKRALACLAE